VFWANATEAVLISKANRRENSGSTRVLNADEEQQNEKQKFHDFDDPFDPTYQQQEKHDNLKCTRGCSHLSQIKVQARFSMVI
jgi:hypothetical protein